MGLPGPSEAGESAHEGVVWCPGVKGAGWAGPEPGEVAPSHEGVFWWPAPIPARPPGATVVSSVALRENGAAGGMSGDGSWFGGGNGATYWFALLMGEGSGGLYCFGELTW